MFSAGEGNTFKDPKHLPYNARRGKRVDPYSILEEPSRNRLQHLAASGSLRDDETLISLKLQLMSLRVLPSAVVTVPFCPRPFMLILFLITPFLSHLMSHQIIEEVFYLKSSSMSTGNIFAISMEYIAMIHLFNGLPDSPKTFMIKHNWSESKQLNTICLFI